MTHERSEKGDALNEQTMLRFCSADLGFALTKIEVSGIVSDKHHREVQLAGAKHLYERAKDILSRLPAASVERTHIPRLLKRVEAALAREQR